VLGDASVTIDPSSRIQRRAASRLRPSSLIALVADQFGLTTVDLVEVAGELDTNYRLTDSSGVNYLVKVSAEDTMEIRWQNELLAAVALADPTLPVPALVPTKSGALLAATAGPMGPVTVRLLTYLPGRPIAGVIPDVDLLTDVGRTAGRLVTALAGVPATDRTHQWDMVRAPQLVADLLPRIPVERHALLTEALDRFTAAYLPVADDLPRCVVHQDLNDMNVLVGDVTTPVDRVTGIIDFGDALHTVRIAELAVSAGYLAAPPLDPMTSLDAMVRGFAAHVPLTAGECAVLYPMAIARAATVAATWLARLADNPEDYGQARADRAWSVLVSLLAVDDATAHAVIRRAAGMQPPADVTALASAIAGVPADRTLLAQVGPARLVDLSGDNEAFDDVDLNDDAAVRASLDRAISPLPSFVGPFAAWHHRASRRQPSGPATLTVGTTVFPPAGTPVPTPVAGTLLTAGPGRIVVQHGDESAPWFSTWWGVSSTRADGEQLGAGSPLGTVAAGTDREPAFVQTVATAGEELARGIPRYVSTIEQLRYSSVLPDPSALLGVDGAAGQPAWTGADVLATRKARFASSQRSYYRRPMNLVRGRDVWLYDENGQGYLDTVNNVTHLGHCEPRVAAAVAAQMRRLNTNSRFVYRGIAALAERLVSTLPAPLDVVFLVCSGSEANDLALRIARQVTGRRDVMVIDGAYHGNTEAVTAISPLRYKGPGGAGTPEHTHEVMTPNRFRGPFGYDDPQAGAHYAADVARVAKDLTLRRRPPAAFIAESLMGSAGHIIHPASYLTRAFEAVRAEGGLVISDEVQVGLGRLGTSFWGFQSQGVVPDIVTLGKAFGNGFPVAALVTTRDIADAFDTGMKYFNTFGGNPVACAAAHTVLDIVDADGLQQHAADVGHTLLRSLTDLSARHDVVGDVRGQGLYCGVELVDPATGAPASALAYRVAERLKDDGVISYPTGVGDNVVKIKPPMTFSDVHVEIFVDALDRALARR
jgi:4-aminobutyrate aminotransferase-like enzyme/Ser/Thr protein kinase RdoA (MazF antagonist)